jgi:hypothetical protein
MHTSKPYEFIYIVMMEILNTLLEINNFLHNLQNECYGLLEIHKCLY